MYDDPEKLQRKIDDYFARGVKTKTVVVGRGDGAREITVKVPTITGLVLYCGFSDRISFYSYEKKEKFANTIKAARTRIESHYEELMQSGVATAGAIFALKNFGWSDKQVLELNDVSKSTDAELINRLSILMAKK
jgi:hypothetical protein